MKSLPQRETILGLPGQHFSSPIIWYALYSVGLLSGMICIFIPAPYISLLGPLFCLYLAAWIPSSAPTKREARRRATTILIICLMSMGCMAYPFLLYSFFYFGLLLAPIAPFFILLGASAHTVLPKMLWGPSHFIGIMIFYVVLLCLPFILRKQSAMLHRILFIALFVGYGVMYLSLQFFLQRIG